MILFFSTTLGFAQEIPELITDRPDQTESPNVVPFDALQLETGFIYQKQKYSEKAISIENDNLILATTLCRYGVNSFMELRFGGEYFIGQTLTDGLKSNLQGIQNILFGAKFNVRKNEKIFSNVGIIIQTILPFGNAELRPDKFIPTFLLSIDQSISDDISFGYNLGAEGITGTDRYYFIYTASLAYDINERLGTFFEFYGSSANQLTPSNNLDCGLTYLIRKNVQVDFSLGTTLINDSTDFFGSIGFSIRIPQ
ncbi:MAG: transporter [Ignavibacteriales bacterium]|nr:transporter [Ignavibacteriales bacterium]